MSGESGGRLDGKVAIITGAARGTGAAMAGLFIQEGARVLLTDIRDELGEKLASELGDNAVYRHMDVTSKADWDAGVAKAVDCFGAVDILVNNAAILLIAAFDEISREDFLRVVEVNLLGPFFGIQAVFGPMKQRGGGSIVNIVSTDGIKGMNGVSAYAASKWGLRGVTKSTAVELGRHAIRINAICPEAGNPNMSSPFFPGNPDLSDIPHQNMQKILKAPEGTDPASRTLDVARMALFLASDESMSCTAADFLVDAGLTSVQRQPATPSA
jgi:3alpha(or 20beta)-hydroxysteroid dehydrogenase